MKIGSCHPVFPNFPVIFPVPQGIFVDGNQRYSWTKNRRSLLVSRALPRHVRPSTISCWRRTAFSASSRAVDLNGATTSAKANQEARSPDQVTRFALLLNG